MKKKATLKKQEVQGSVSWGEAEVLDFEQSDSDKHGAGFYPDPDSDSDSSSDGEPEPEAPKGE